MAREIGQATAFFIAITSEMVASIAVAVVREKVVIIGKKALADAMAWSHVGRGCMCSPVSGLNASP
jgi:hypothetical protein